MKKFFVVLLAAVMIFTFAACSGGSGSGDADTSSDVEIGTVVVGIDATYPPFQWTNDDGSFDGFEIAMFNEIASRAGFDVEYQALPWDGIFGQMDSEKIDTVMVCIFPNEERLEKYDFSREYIYDENKFIVPKGEGHNYKTLQDFEGKTIGVSGGGNSYLVLQEAQKEVPFEIKTYSDEEEIFELDLGRLDAIYKSPVFAMEAAKQNNLNVEVADCPAYQSASCAIPWRKNDERAAAIRELVSKYTQEMIDDGTMKELSEKYFGMDVTCYEPLFDFSK